MNNNISVSVCMITYGQELFIKQAIESILVQQCDFKIELIISDDCSPDNTKLIVEELMRNYTKSCCIKYHRQENNVGFHKNLTYALSACKGKYIAICEGDDYWTDPLKLQKQIAVLEADKECNISFHNCKIVDKFGNEEDLVYKKELNKLYFEDLMNGEFTKTVTCMFRQLPHFDTHKIIDDTTLFLNVLEKGGYADYLNDTMACYRIHDGGVWSKKNALKRFELASLTEKLIKKSYLSTHTFLVNKREKSFFKNSFIEMGKEGMYIESFKKFLQYIKLEKNWTNLFTGLLIFIKINLKSFIDK